MAINRSNIKLQVTRGNKMKQLKDVPEGNKGKGLSKLPTAVRNKMGFKKQGGVIKAQSGTGKDPILSKEERRPSTLLGGSTFLPFFSVAIEWQLSGH